MTEADERAAQLKLLTGNVIRVTEADDVITLVYADGRTVELTGLGYDGYFQHVIVANGKGETPAIPDSGKA